MKIFINKILACLFSVLSAVNILPYSMLPQVKLEGLSETTLSTENFDFKYDKGRFCIAFDGVTMFCDAYSEAKTEKYTVFSYEYDSFELSETAVSDERGNGKEIEVLLTKDGLISMKQHFTFYDSTEYFLTYTELLDENEVASNYIAPIVIEEGNVQNGNPLYTNFLEVPFDNDAWVEFEISNLYESGIGHEVGAFFNPETDKGFVLGSVTHDKWKSAVEYSGEFGKIKELNVYSGANTALTRDQSPHGTVKGERISSAIFFVGFYDNWKDGMYEFADINTTFTPKRKSVISSNPIGWNSWGSIQDKLSFDNAIATSDYIKNNLQQTWQSEDNVVYINLDSYWDNLTDEQMRDFVKHCEENGQIAGIYSAPFIVWWDEYGMQNNYVPGTDISYNDIRLKKADGTYYSNDIDGCYPLDVTHPATYIHFKTQLERLMNCGFKYIKLDFLVHGSLEGQYYDSSIETGIEAYNYAMGKVNEIIGEDVFINLSMAPIFPYNYANGRRLACDSYYSIDNTEYTLNALTYGFWQSRLYDYIDPDHIVLWGKDGKAGEAEARSRLLSGIVSGGSFLAGDNFVNPVKNSEKAFERYETLLGNEKIIDIIKNGKPFDGEVTSKCEYAAKVFTLKDGEKTYIAVFNYGLGIERHVLDVPENSVAENLFTGDKTETKNGKMSVVLAPKDCAIFEITV